MDKQQIPFFSVVIPVYNVEDYLRQCVESVLQQTFPDFELILVDDGSPDRSGELCDILAKGDSRIRVLHQKNMGLSGARNSGLELARGDYILFLDSDDFYPQTTFLQMLRDAWAGEDVICFNYARYTDKLLANMIAFPSAKGLAWDELLLELIKCNAYTSSACLKAVKRKLLLEENITFEVGVLSEDIEWNARVMGAARSGTIAPECVYAYRVRQGSISKTVSDRHALMQLRIIRKLLAAAPEGSEAFCRAYNGYIGFQYSALMINALMCRPRLKAEDRAQVKELAWLLKYDANRIVRLIRIVHRTLGFEITSWLLLIYFKLFCK